MFKAIRVNMTSFKKTKRPDKLVNKTYKILTKSDYIEWRICGEKPINITVGYIDMLNGQWEKVSKGYKFVILAGEMIYSVEYFNKNILI